jgi:hypothetical protein
MIQVEMINYRPEEQAVYILTDLEYVDGHIGGDATQDVLPATGMLSLTKFMSILLTMRRMRCCNSQLEASQEHCWQSVSRGL